MPLIVVWQEAQMSRKTPQQKKALSYRKDRRNCYGENDKSSRKNIPRARARKQRAYRHKVAQALHVVPGVAVPRELEQIETNVSSLRRRTWKKVPDEPLGEHLAHQVKKRAASVNSKILRRTAREASARQGDGS